MIYFYNLIFPFAFLFYLPALVYKFIKRGGVKENYAERFALFSKSKKEELAGLKNRRVWIHAVSVGETQIAIDFINEFRKVEPDFSLIVSTTTTTGQELARNRLKNIASVIFCPLDFISFVKRTFNLLKPELLIIFETEIWPAMIWEAHRRGVKIAQLNSRISDRSFRGYKKISFLIKPFLSLIDIACTQTDDDLQRLKSICPSLDMVKTGNMKFDQKIPEQIPDIDLKKVFGEGQFIYLLAASTHQGEEKLIISIYKKMLESFKNLRLIIVPRHAERGSEIAKEIESAEISYFRRSDKYSKSSIESMVLLADTTGELLSFIKISDLVIMGKCFAGNDGGHNVIEPALLSKAIITGKEISNFRFVLKVMLENKAIVAVSESELEEAVRKLLENPEERRNLGAKAKIVVSQNIGATQRNIQEIRKLLNK